MSFDIFGSYPDEERVTASRKTVLTPDDLSDFSFKDVKNALIGLYVWYGDARYLAYMNFYLKKIRPLYLKRLQPSSATVYRVTGISQVLTLDKLNFVWKARTKNRPISSFTTKSSPGEWLKLAKKLGISGLVISAEADLNSIAFTSRIVWDFAVVCEQLPEKDLQARAYKLKNRVRDYWSENEVALLYPIKSKLVAAIGYSKN